MLAGGWCYVREIVMPTYAKAFAAAGINAMIFDYRNLGVSDGDNRQHLDPWAQIRDYQNAISFLERHEAVDPNRIGVWGISYSGGHALILAAIDPRVKSIVSQIPVIDGYENMRRAHGTVEFRRLWDLVLKDRKLRYERPGERLYLPHATENSEAEVSAWPFPETVRTFMAIKAKEAPLYENRSTVESVDLLMTYDVGPFVKRIYNTPDLHDRRRRRRSDPVGSRNQRLQRGPERAQETARPAAHHAHDALFGRVQGGDSGEAGDELVSGDALKFRCEPALTRAAGSGSGGTNAT